MKITKGVMILLALVLMSLSALAIIPIGPIIGGDTGRADQLIITPLTYTTPTAKLSREDQPVSFDRETTIGGAVCSVQPDKSWDSSGYGTVCFVNNDFTGVAFQGFLKPSVAPYDWVPLCSVSPRPSACSNNYEIQIKKGDSMKCFNTQSGQNYHFNVYYCQNVYAPKCTDTDGSNDKTFGFVTETGSGTQSTEVDECSGDVLQERICGSDNTIATLSVNCKIKYGSNYECQDGACKAGTVCTNNFKKKCYGGNVYWYNSCGDRGSVYDQCTPSTEICTNAQCIVPYNPPTPPSTCSDGIKNGAETGIDCGGSCTACTTPAPSNTCYSCSGNNAVTVDLPRAASLKTPSIWDWFTSAGRAGTNICEDTTSSTYPILYTSKPTCIESAAVANPDYFKPQSNGIVKIKNPTTGQWVDVRNGIPANLMLSFGPGDYMDIIAEFENTAIFDSKAYLASLGGDQAKAQKLVAKIVSITNLWNSVLRVVEGVGKVFDAGVVLSPGATVVAADKDFIDAENYINFAIVEIGLYSGDVADKAYPEVYSRFALPTPNVETVTMRKACQGTEDEEGWLRHFTVVITPKIDGKTTTYGDPSLLPDGQTYGGASKLLIKTRIKVPVQGDKLADGSSNYNTAGKYYLHTALFDRCYGVNSGTPIMDVEGKQVTLKTSSTPPDQINGTCCKTGILFSTTYSRISIEECSALNGAADQSNYLCDCPDQGFGDYVCIESDLDHVYRLKTTKDQFGNCNLAPTRQAGWTCSEQGGIDNEVCGIGPSGQAACLDDIDKNNIPDIEEPNKQVCCFNSFFQTPTWKPMAECGQTLNAQVITGGCPVRKDPFCGDGICNEEECVSDCGAPKSVCGDGQCAADEENCACAADCGCPNSICIIDGVCIGDETRDNCPADCVKTACNYNNICNAGEDKISCPDDCHETTVCGPDSSGIRRCDAGETQATCCEDCGGCEQVCNNNGICEVTKGETKINCVPDCKDHEITVFEGYKKSDEVWCIRTLPNATCYPRKAPIELTPENLANIEELSGPGKVAGSWMEDSVNPICLTIYGKVQCADNAICLPARNSALTANKDNKAVYDALYDVILINYEKVNSGLLDLVTLGALPAFNWLTETDSINTKEVQRFGVCTYAGRGFLDSIKRWIAVQLGVDPSDSKVTYVLYGVTALIVIILIMLLKPPKQRNPFQ